jgi:hypothetical protein
MSNNIIVIGVWQGDNYTAVVAGLFRVNPDIKIQVSRNKLLVEHKPQDFYQAFPKGESIALPGYLKHRAADRLNRFIDRTTHH